MTTEHLSLKNILKTLGPGLLFAGAAIGTSHLVLATRAGAHHGMLFIWIILGALLLKYPFFEFGPRYASATGHSLIQGYRDQGIWAIILFMVVISIGMFAVVAAVGGVSAGLLNSMLGLDDFPLNYTLTGIFVFTALMLLVGRYTTLEYFIKFISVVLFLTIVIAFIAVLIKGPIEPAPDFSPNNNLLEGAGLALLISLIGWMPSGLETSTMLSIWTVEKTNANHHRPTLKESLFDFRLGYFFTIILALLFLTIGAYSVYGSGQLLDDPSATKFSNQLIAIFTAHLGAWSKPVITIAAFGAIYGTLLTAWDAFSRSFVRGLRAFKYEELEENAAQEYYLNKSYNIVLIVIGVGAFILFTQFTGSMLSMLKAATILSFLTAPVIGYLNLKAIQSKAVPESHRPAKWMILLSNFCLVLMVGFSLYYLWVLLN